MTDQDKINLMIEKTKEVMKNAYVPYSNYRVGMCVESEKGNLFCGCNVENASYGLTLCAEDNAISTMIASGDKKIKSIVLIGSGEELCTPCGKCRQVIREFASPDTKIHLCNKERVVKTTTIEELLPDSFGPDHL